MRYLILSDIHANLHALEAALADAGTIGYDATLMLGDVVGYGADPEAAVVRTMALEPVAIIRGNHDKVCAGLEPSTQFNDIARIAAEWTIGVLSAEALRTLAGLPRGPVRVGDRLEIAHGANFDEDFYIFDADDAARAIDRATAAWSFVGHTHVPALYAAESDPIRRLDAGPLAAGGHEDVFALPRRGPALINVGSIGQPRDGDPRAAYGLLDTDAATLRLRRVPYDIAGAQARILEAELPPYLALRLARGQ